MKKPAALILAASFAFAPAVLAEPPRRPGPIFPSEDDLRALGEMTDRWMRDLAGHLTPMVDRLEALVDDLDAYEAPERLPNGDIVIRRKPRPAPETVENHIDL